MLGAGSWLFLLFMLSIRGGVAARRAVCAGHIGLTSVRPAARWLLSGRASVRSATTVMPRPSTSTSASTALSAFASSPSLLVPAVRASGPSAARIPHRAYPPRLHHRHRPASPVSPTPARAHPHSLPPPPSSSSSPSSPSSPHRSPYGHGSDAPRGIAWHTSPRAPLRLPPPSPS